MPRARASSPSSSNDGDKEALLSALNAHGQSFLQSFSSLPSVSGAKRKRAPTPPPDDEEEEEWQGIAHSGASDSDNHSAGESESSERQSTSPPRTGPRVVVFAQSNGGDIASSSHASRKAFMSSKVSKMRADTAQSRYAEDAEDEEEEEKSNTRNDILLHELVQNSLLSGVLDAGDQKTPSKKRKAIEGRAMELAGTVKRGRGQRVLQTSERGHAPKRIREGMQLKEAELNAKRLEEAKNVGNYHPTIKKLFGAEERAPQRKRERGLSLGVGKFVRGTLQLTPRDLARVRGSSTGGGDTGGRGGRGGSRGRGKSRR